jgi:hypothetical protein
MSVADYEEAYGANFSKNFHSLALYIQKHLFIDIGDVEELTFHTQYCSRVLETARSIDSEKSLAQQQLQLLFPRASDGLPEDQSQKIFKYLVERFLPGLQVFDSSIIDVINSMTLIIAKKDLDTRESFIQELKSTIASVKQKQELAGRIQNRIAAIFDNPKLDPNNVMDLLFMYIKEAGKTWNENPKVYAPYFSLIGPSMSGKSFLLRQLSKQPKMYVAYLCLRPKGSSGFPPRTPIFADQFISTKHRTKYRMFYASFIVACLRCMSTMEPRIFNEKWYGADMEFFQDLNQSSEKILFKANGNENAITQEIKSAWDAIKGQFGSAEPSIIFAIDEARGLLSTTEDIQKANSNFYEFRRALKFLPKTGENECYPPVSIVTDTIAKLANFSPSAKNDHSWRTAEHDEILLPPFHYLTFVDIYEKKDPVTLENLDDEFRLYHLGRPHWGAYLGNEKDV